jgi:hypothetical protein
MAGAGILTKSRVSVLLLMWAKNKSHGCECAHTLDYFCFRGANGNAQPPIAPLVVGGDANNGKNFGVKSLT